MQSQPPPADHPFAHSDVFKANTEHTERHVLFAVLPIIFDVMTPRTAGMHILYALVGFQG